MPHASRKVVKTGKSDARTSVSKGVVSVTDRRREFFQKLKENLSDDCPERRDRLVKEFRTLLLGQ